MKALPSSAYAVRSPILHATGAQFPGLELFESPEKAVAAADALLARRHAEKSEGLSEGPPQHRVIVFPNGGTCFPLPPRTPAKGGL